MPVDWKNRQKPSAIAKRVIQNYQKNGSTVDFQFFLILDFHSEKPEANPSRFCSFAAGGVEQGYEGRERSRLSGATGEAYPLSTNLLSTLGLKMIFYFWPY